MTPCYLAVSLRLPAPLPSVANLREHWRAKHARAKFHRQAAWAILKATGAVAPALPVVVRLTRVAPRSLDGDNLQGACKALRDGVADWLGVDDGDPGITWEYQQRSGGPKVYRVEIEIITAEALGYWPEAP